MSGEILSGQARVGGTAALPIVGGLLRREFLAGLLILGCVNGFTSRIIEAVNRDGWADALFNTFDISVIVLVSSCVGVFLVLLDQSDQTNVTDLAVGVAYVLLVALPISDLSWVAVAALSIYVLASTKGVSTRQGAVILLATTIPMFWSGLLFRFFANPILNADASLVSWVLGTGRAGNIVELPDHSGHLVIFGPCSSLANVSLGILCWVTVSELAGRKRSPYDIFWCLFASAAVIAVNVARMALMGVSESLYKTVHGNFGAALTSLIITVVTISICVFGARRELFPRI